jgi:hypothetical protein
MIGKKITKSFVDFPDRFCVFFDRDIHDDMVCVYWNLRQASSPIVMEQLLLLSVRGSHDCVDAMMYRGLASKLLLLV